MTNDNVDDDDDGNVDDDDDDNDGEDEFSMEKRRKIDPKHDPKSTPNRPQIEPKSAPAPEGCAGHDSGHVSDTFSGPRGHPFLAGRPREIVKKTPKIQERAQMPAAGATRDSRNI